MPDYALLTERANHAESGTRLASVSNHSLAGSGSSLPGEHHAVGLSARRANKERRTARARRTAAAISAVIRARRSMPRTSPALQLMVSQRLPEWLPCNFRYLGRYISSDYSSHQQCSVFLGVPSIAWSPETWILLSILFHYISSLLCGALAGTDKQHGNLLMSTYEGFYRGLS